MAQLYLDLEETERVFEGRWLWSASRRNLAEFRRSDYLGPAHRPLIDVVRDCAERASDIGRKGRCVSSLTCATPATSSIL